MSKITVQCPVCKEGDIIIEYWSYAATYEDPADEGFEIASSTCECELTDEQLYKALMEELKAYAKAQQEQELEDDRRDYELFVEEEFSRLWEYQKFEEEHNEGFK